MMDRVFRLMVCLAVLVMATTPAFGQGSGSTLSGVVTDSGGGVIPGATVVVKNNATNVSQTVVTNAAGAFSVPALNAGTYTVTVSLSGFKTVVISDVRLLAATPAEVKAVLEVGALTETVEVRGGTELVQTQSATVQSTISVEQIKELPLVSRNALYFVSFLPGVETSSGPRGSTISGLPQNTINITIDGVTTGNQLQSGDGFFSMVTPRLDAVEEITVTGAVPGSGGGQGSVQVAFVTRAGSNKFDSSVYHYARRPSFNSNAFFNKVRGLPRNEVIVDQYGGRVGGPMIIPGLLDGRGKAFFFFNFEHLRQPNSATRTRTIVNPDAQFGLFRWAVSGETRSRNVIDLAAQSGQLATFDPVVSALLAQIRNSTSGTGTVTTPANALNTQSFAFQSTTKGDQYSPTTRVDFNLTPSQRLTGTYYWQRFKSNPDLLNNVDPQYPGFPNFATQNSYRTTGSITLRSTLGASMVNELKGGWQWSPNEFFTNVTRDMFQNQGFYALGLGFGLNNATATASPGPRNTTNWTIDNTLNWLRGNHSLSVVGAFSQILNRATASTVVPRVTLGLNTQNDPANAMFTTANFPGASTTDLNNARALYALLTGRVSAINATGRLDASTGRYVYNGSLEQKAKMNSFNFFVQDSWRLTPTVTLNAGLRYEVQLPFTPITPTYSTSDLATLCGISGVGSGPGGRECNLFQPGTLAGQGVVGAYQPFNPGDKAYNTDWNNLAPNVGLAWRPNVQDGVMRAILGDPEQATVRAGYAVSYNLERFDRFTGIFGGNPGGTVNANRNVNNGNLVLPGETWPLLLRDQSRLGPPTMPDGPSYPILPTTANNVNIFDPNIRTPYVESYSVGFQRSLDRDTAIEVRYVGNRNQQAWTTENWNERVIFENGFMNEFQVAMNNLQAHVAQGCSGSGNACSFAYRGPGTGTTPLPTYLAYFTGRSDASTAAAYTGTNWTNTAYTGDLSPLNANIGSTVNDLSGSAAFRANAIGAGLAPNFFYMNPGINNANITKSLAGSRYHSMQVDLRRRLSKGLLVQASYTYARTFNSSLQSLRLDRFYLESQGVPHAVKMNWTYDIPVGRGRRYGTDMNKVLDGILGGWEFSGTGRWQRQQLNAGSVRLVGMTKDELQDEFKIRIVRDAAGTTTVFSMPDDIILNTRRAFNTDPTSATGYSALGVPEGRYIAPRSTPGCIPVYVGDCDVDRQVFVLAPAFTRFDMRIKKLFSIGGRATAEVNFEVLNVFDNINFNHQMNPGAGTGIFQVTGAYTDINTTFDPGGRLGQVVWRISW